MIFTDKHEVNVTDRAPWIKSRVSSFGFTGNELGYEVDKCSFSIGAKGALKKSGKILSASDQGVTVEAEDILTESAYGDFQTRVILTADKLKELKGVVSIPFKSKGMSFYKQPYLTGGPSPLEGYEPNEDPAKQEGFSKRLIEDICGGFIVMDAKSNEKFFNLTRPRIFLDGVEGLKDHPEFPGFPIPVVELDITSNEFMYTVDPEWLAKIGSGNIVIDPNLGYDSIGATNGVDSNRMTGTLFTEGTGDTYDTFYFYNGADVTPSNIGLCIYNDSATTPASLNTDAGDPAGATGWINTSTSFTSSTSTPYWLSFQGHDGTRTNGETVDPRYDLTGANHESSTALGVVIGNDPADRTAPSTGTRKYSIYLSPVPGGSNAPLYSNHVNRLNNGA